MQNKIAVIEAEDLASMIRKVIREENKANDLRKCYTVNEVATQLKLAHGTVKKMLERKLIGSTADGHITEYHLKEYLNNR
jgi:hypothetical protein